MSRRNLLHLLRPLLLLLAGAWLTPGLARPVSGPQSDRESDTVRRITHRIGIEYRPEYIFPTNPFLRGENFAERPMRLGQSVHLRYAFRFAPGSRADRLYGGAYQGLGAAWYNFRNSKELGNPGAVYLFQGARIARITPRLSFDYEWNFGLSFGWRPFDWDTNINNIMTGSRINAYLNVDFLFRYALSRRFDLTAGIALTHFSNGNTSFPNAGLNTGGLKVGIVYDFGRREPAAPAAPQADLPAFSRHVCYDLTLFGAWRRKILMQGDTLIAPPDAYTVLGFDFAALYNVNSKFRAGLSLDGVYDGSANLYSEDYLIGQEYIRRPPIGYQLALGISARGEFVMPYFTISFGLGVNVLRKGHDLRGYYQILALKIATGRHTYINIGYRLKDFHMPSHLMLGAGIRFNDKRAAKP